MEFWQYLSWVPNQNLLILPVDAYFRLNFPHFLHCESSELLGLECWVIPIEKSFENVIKSAIFYLKNREKYILSKIHYKR